MLGAIAVDGYAGWTAPPDESSPARWRSASSALTSTSTLHCCWKPRIAKATRRSCTGTRISVKRPRIEGSRVGSSKPALSRSNHAGPGDRGDHREQDRQPGGHRQHAAVPLRDEVGHHDVHDHVADRDHLRALELRPAAERHHRDQQRAREEQQDHNGPRGLGLSLVPVGVVQDGVGHREAQYPGPGDLVPVSAGVVELGRHASFRCSWPRGRGGSIPSARIDGVGK